MSGSSSTPTGSPLPRKRKPKSNRWNSCPECGGRKTRQAELCKNCSPRTKRSTALGRLRVSERGAYGVIATLISESGTTRVREYQGTPHEALTDLVSWIDRQQEQWLIVCLSTPMTILSDLTRHQTGGPSLLPEFSLLGRAGRKDLLAAESARLRGATRS